MKKIARLLSAAFLMAACSPAEKLSDYVDPMIGSAHSRWFFFTPAALPFGMAKLAPTTDGHYGNRSGWEAVGYDYRHNSIEGFASFHEFQIGGLIVAPVTGEIKTVPGTKENPDCGYRSRFDKKDETAKPGYYSVLLKDYDVFAELTATGRVGFHRYTFPEGSAAALVFNIGTRMGESGPCTDAQVRYLGDGKVEGWVETQPMYTDHYQEGARVRMYFSAEMDAVPCSFGSFVNDISTLKTYKSEDSLDEVSAPLEEARNEVSGPGAGMYFRFDTSSDRDVEIKMGLSYTSVENARANLEAEASGLDFDAAKKRAEDIWERELGRIKVTGGTREARVKFYTGLYHALLGRGLASDVNGAYPANDGSVGQIELDENGRPLHNFYNTDAVWGAQWNLTQLWTLAWPEYFSDWISGQLLVYKDSGWLADGIANSRYVSGVGTNFVGQSIAAAYNCGIRDFDVDLGYEAALKDVVCGDGRPLGAGKEDVSDFVENGYVTGTGFSASHTLEYCFNCYAVARMAELLGKSADYEKLMKLSRGWEQIFDPETGLIRPRDDSGRFIEPFDPFAPWIGFQEGNAVQYTYYVPHDIERLVEKIGRDDFNTRLDSTFIISRENVFGGGKVINAFSGLHTYYNHGNQPNLHISGLFNFSGKPWLSQKWMRTICNEFYGTEGIHGYGYGQDEDQGQLGAWYVMASMGLFDVKGLSSPEPSFQIASPLFDRITISLNPDYCSGKKFVIETEGNSEENIYIGSISLNGKKMNSVQLPLSEIQRGGKLKLVMSGTPNTEIVK
ncbi:MAG: GH92 family glycosyl hydrolase [Candidatus Cryptobacteroides sp.]